MRLKPLVVCQAFLLVGLFNTEAGALPTVEVETRYYPVKGKNLQEIYQGLQRNGPNGDRGKTFHAHTEWDIQWSYRWIESDDACRITEVDVDIKISLLLPRLANPNSLEDSVKSSWGRYYKALLEHEEHHKEYGIKAAHELDDKLRSLPPQECFGMQNRLSDFAQEIVGKYDAMEKAYDLETNHGINEGVVLQ